MKRLNIKKISTTLLALLLFSCSNNEYKETEKKQAVNIEVAKKMFEHFNRHDWEGLSQLYSEPCEFLDPSLGKNPVNLDRRQHAAHHRRLSDMSPDIKDDIISVYASGSDAVVVEFVSSGTARNGVQWSLPLCCVLSIREGLIVKDHVYYDNSN